MTNSIGITQFPLLFRLKKFQSTKEVSSDWPKRKDSPWSERYLQLLLKKDSQLDKRLDKNSMLVYIIQNNSGQEINLARIFSYNKI